MDAGAVAIVVIMVLLLPSAIFIGGMAFAAVLGWSLTADAAQRAEGTEHAELSA